MRPVIYCADIGSIPNGRFGWARSAAAKRKIERHRGGTEIVELVDGLADDLAAGHGVALGFERPLFVPVPEQPLRLGTASASGWMFFRVIVMLVSSCPGLRRSSGPTPAPRARL